MPKAAKTLLIVVGIVVVLFCAASLAIDRFMLNQTYARTPERTPNLLARYEDFASDYARTDLQFEYGGYTLSGHVYGADNIRGLIVFRHGIFSQHQDYLPLICAMVDKGWRVFAYDAIGCGESDGDSTLGMSQSPLDVAAAVEFVRSQQLDSGMPLALWGHSWGGYGVAGALSLAPDVDACVTMSGFDTPFKILDASARRFMGPLGATQAPFMQLWTAIDFGSNANISGSQSIVDSQVPTLVIHGTGDAVVPFEGVSIADALKLAGRGGEGDTVRIIEKSDAGRNGHNDFFYSRDSQNILGGLQVELQELLDANDDDVTAPEVQAFLAQMDKRAANTADPALIDEIDGFLAQTLGV